MSKSIYVGNLPFTITKQDLFDFLADIAGVVSIHLVTDRETGQSRGFAFVELDSASNALTAITTLNGKDLDGRALTVNEARAREERSGGGDRGRERSGGFGSRRY